MNNNNNTDSTNNNPNPLEEDPIRNRNATEGLDINNYDRINRNNNNNNANSTNHSSSSGDFPARKPSQSYTTNNYESTFANNNYFTDTTNTKHNKHQNETDGGIEMESRGHFTFKDGKKPNSSIASTSSQTPLLPNSNDKNGAAAQPLLAEPSQAALGGVSGDDELTAKAAVSERLARRRDKKKQQPVDSSNNKAKSTKGKEKGKETQTKEAKTGGGGAGSFGDPWVLIARASELQTNALLEKKIIPDLAKAIESCIGFIQSAHNVERLPDILCPFLAEHGHKYLAESSLHGMSQLFFSFRLDPKDVIYRQDRMVLEILHQKESFPEKNLHTDKSFTEQVAAEFAVLSSERIHCVVTELTLSRRELYRDAANFDSNSVSLTVRALTLLIEERSLHNNTTTRIFRCFGLLEAVTLLLVKLTGQTNERGGQEGSPFFSFLPSSLCEAIASLLLSCSTHEYLAEYFKNNNGYYGMVQSMGNLVGLAPTESADREKTLYLILQTLITLEKRFYGNLVKISNVYSGSKATLHSALLRILNNPHFGDSIYSLTFELCKLVSPVFCHAKRNELSCALAAFYAAGKLVQLYRATLTSGVLYMLTTLSPPSSSSSLPPPPNDWTPLLCTLLFHLLHFREQQHVLHAFETFLLLKSTDNLWKAMLEMVEGVGVQGLDKLVELDRRPASISTPSILSKWLGDNGPKLSSYCSEILEQHQIKYKAYSL